MTGIDTAETLAAYLKDAARLRRMIEPWIQDRRFEAEGGRIVYAVDTNMVVFYSDPPGQSPDGDGKRTRSEGYAQVFREDSKELAIALGSALTDHIFGLSLGHGLPRLLLPPLDEEVARIFSAIAGDADQEQAEARDELAKLVRAARELEALVDDEPALLKKIKEKAPVLMGIVQGLYGPSAQLRRLGNLFSENILTSLDYIIDNASYYQVDDDMRRAFAPFSDVLDLVWFYDRNALWMHRLEQTKAASTKRKKLEADASALARLEWINRCLQKSNVRVVQVTGDNAVLLAASEYVMDNGQIFSDVYLRHPLSFLGAVLSGKFDDEAEERGSLIDLLDVFLGKISYDASDIVAQLDKIIKEDERHLAESVRPVLEPHPTIVSDFRSRWDAFTSNVAVQYFPKALDSLDLGDRVNIGDLFGHIHKKLEEQVADTWSACFNAVTRTGFDILAFQRRERVVAPRNPPPIYFKSFPKTFDFIKTIMSLQAKGKIDPDIYAQALNEMMEEDRGFGYLYYLSYAFLFAAAGRWHIAAILSEQAYRISKKSNDPRRIQEISGREAAYMLVVAKRHSAKRLSDLDEVRGRLREVFDCYERDRDKRPDLNAWPVRFVSEEIALDITAYMFRRFERESSRLAAQPAKEIFNRLVDAIHSIEPDMDSWVRLHIERNLLTNLFLIAIFRRFYEMDMDVSSDLMIPFFERFTRNLDEKVEPEIAVSFLVGVIYKIAAWWMESDPKRRKNCRNQVLYELVDIKIQQACVFPYDKARFEFFRSVVSKAS